MRPTRMGISHSNLPLWELRICSMGFGRPGGAFHSPSELRGTCCRKLLPNLNRSARDGGRCRNEGHWLSSSRMRDSCPEDGACGRMDGLPPVRSDLDAR